MARHDPAMVGPARYERKVLDHYPTIDEEVTKAIVPILIDIGFRSGDLLWECAAGAGDMARVLLPHFPNIIATDVEPKVADVDVLDFLRDLPPEIAEVSLIVTNPPYAIADDFFSRAAELAEEYGTHTFMVCRNEFDSASDSPRTSVFDSQFYRGKFPLRWRPKWFEDDPEDGRSGSPRHNYAWFWIGPGLADPIIIYLDRARTVERRQRRSLRERRAK